VRESCAEYQARIKGHVQEEDMSLETIVKVTKPCPGCRTNVQKNGGCGHITCEYARVLLIGVWH
jgi:hypothetical protein